MTVAAADVAQALDAAWQVFLKTASDGAEGWDAVDAIAEVRPE